MEHHPGSPLALDAERMRRLGYRTVDMLVDRITGDQGAVVRSAPPDQLLERLARPAPAGPCSFDELLDQLERDVLPYVARISHPGYLAFVPGEGTWPGALGDLISSALNVDTCWWLGASGPAALELVVLDWIREWAGYPREARGVLTSGGSASNLTAMACAREALLGPMDTTAVAYLSDQAHASLAKGARALGFRPDQVRVLGSDAIGRMRVDALESAIAADLAGSRRPLMVIASAGTTGLGAIDPFSELATICRRHGMWLHVDGAYGGFACLTERGREALRGMELADSVTLDPHKWLYQPVELGALLVRDGTQLRRAFEVSHDYLKDVQADMREVNFSDLGLQLTRSSRALKMWMSIRYFGLDAFRAAIDGCLDLAAHAERLVREHPELELGTPASLGVVTFRRRPAGVDDEAELERITEELVAQIEREGEVFVSTTRAGGRLVVRLCILNHSTSAAMVERAVELVATLPVTAAPAAAGGGRAREAPVQAGWLSRPQLDAAALRSLPLFASLADDQADRVLARLRERTAATGEPVVGQWQAGRDLYVVLDGVVTVDADGHDLARLGPGEFFGELAAIDWGAGFGRSRSATVTAAAPSRLLVLDWELVNWLMKAAPAFGEQVEQTARERLAAAALASD